MRDPALVRGIDAPSVVLRAVVSVALLVGFYVLVSAVSLGLFSLPVLFVMRQGIPHARLVVALFVLCWIPGAMLFTGLWRVPAPPPLPRGDELTEAQAPELFAILRALSREASVPPPSRVCLTAEMNLAVAEEGRERVVCIGAPVLASMRVDEVRAGIAHEMGHFAFGDTRLGGVIAYTHGAFRAVLHASQPRDRDTDSTAVAAAFGLADRLAGALVVTYARLFFGVTRPASRRAELAADQLAARLADRDALIRLLCKIEPVGVLFDAYLDGPVRRALDEGFLPTDLLAGFELFRAHMEERGLIARIRADLDARPEDPYDSHPSTGDRVAAIRRAPSGAPTADARRASSLLQLDLDEWTVAHFAAKIPPRSQTALTRGPWRTVWHARAERIRQDANDLTARLRPRHPDANTLASGLRALVRDLSRGEALDAMALTSPEVLRHSPSERPEAARRAMARCLGVVLTGAMVERGAPAVFPFDDDTPTLLVAAGELRPFQLAADALRDPSALAALEGWVNALETPLGAVEAPTRGG